MLKYIIAAILVILFGIAPVGGARNAKAAAGLAVAGLAVAGASALSYFVVRQPENPYGYLNVPCPADTVFSPDYVIIGGRETHLIITPKRVIYAGVNRPRPAWVDLDEWQKRFGKLTKEDRETISRCFPNF